MVQSVRLHMGQMWEPPGKVGGDLARIVRPLIHTVIIKIGVYPKNQKERRLLTQYDTPTRLCVRLQTYDTTVASEVIERSRDYHVKVQIDAAILH